MLTGMKRGIRLRSYATVLCWLETYRTKLFCLFRGCVFWLIVDLGLFLWNISVHSNWLGRCTKQGKSTLSVMSDENSVRGSEIESILLNACQWLMVLSHHITLQWILIILLACSVKGIVHPRIKPLINLLVLMFFQTKTFCSFKQTRLSELLIYVPWKRIVIVNNACKILHAKYIFNKIYIKYFKLF